MPKPLASDGVPQNPTHRDVAKKEVRDTFGKFVKKVKDIPVPPLVSTKDTAPSEDPPLVNLKVTNPVTYFKNWWKKLMANEGIELKGQLKVHALTAIAIPIIAFIILVTGTFTIGILINYILKTPAAPLVPAVLLPTPTTDPWRASAFSGLLRQTGSTYYLVTGDGEAITLSVPQNTNLEKYLGKRIFATGRYNSQTGVLVVNEASDLEVLPNGVTTVPTPLFY